MYRIVVVLMAFTALVSQVSAQGMNREIILRNPSGNTLTLRPPTPLANYTLFFPGTAPGLGALMYTHNTTGGSSWLSAGPTNTIFQIIGGVPTWQAPATALDDDFVRYNLLAPQNLATTAGGNFLFNLEYGTTSGASAAGARINSVTTAANSNATGLTTNATATGTGTARGIDIVVSGGANATALRTDANITTGTTTTYKGLELSNANISGGAALTTQYGIDIEQLTGATTNTPFRYNHPTAPIVMTGAGSVGIGVSSPTIPLDVVRTFTPVDGPSQSQSFTAGRFNAFYSPTAVVNSANSWLGTSSFAILNNSQAVNSDSISVLGGFFASVQTRTSTAPVTGARGIVGLRGQAVSQCTTEVLPKAVAVWSSTQATGADITAGVGFRTEAIAVEGGSFTTFKGIEIANAIKGDSASITTQYGIDIDQLTSGTTNIAFRYNHASAPVTIQGNGSVGIGITPTTSLDVDGGLVVRPPSTISVGTAGNITVGNRSYIRLQPTANVNVGLAAGSAAGHVLVVEVLNNGGNQLTFVDNAAQNLDLSGGANFSPNNAAVITFIWNGSIWMEVSRTVNN